MITPDLNDIDERLQTKARVLASRLLTISFGEQERNWVALKIRNVTEPLFDSVGTLTWVPIDLVFLASGVSDDRA